MTPVPGGSTNQVRITTYVSAGTTSDNRDSAENSAEALAIGAAAEQHALAYEQAQGRVATKMGHFNRGYDIESKSGDETWHIEVKGIDGPWSGGGVGMSRHQFLHAQELGDRFWLYVIEHVRGPAPTVIYRIRNPASMITGFMVDSGWKALAESVQSPRVGTAGANKGSPEE